MNTQSSKRVNKILRRGKKAPSEDELQEISELIFAPNTNNSVKYVIEGKGNKPEIFIHCLAKHQHVYEVLNGDSKEMVSLSQYDQLLGNITNNINFFLGEKISKQPKRWDILQAAMNVDPALNRNSRDFFEDVSRNATRKAISYIFKNQKDPDQFNIVREYGYLIPYFAASEFTGVSLPSSPSFLLRAFTFWRNKTCRGKVELKDDMASSSELLMWSHFIFGHMFANIGNRNAGLNFLASKASKKFDAQITRSIADFQNIDKNSLLGRFETVRSQFTGGNTPVMSETDFNHHIKCILFELTGTMQLLVGSAFANILGVISDHSLGLQSFLDHVATDEIALDEALRLSTPTTTLYRVATETFELDGQTINKNDYVCLMVQHACMDSEAFPNPGEFSVKGHDKGKRNPKDYLSFGPFELTPNTFNPTDGTHPCFGQYWARTLLKSMLNGLTQFENLNIPKTEEPTLLKFQSIPDAIMASHKNPQFDTQNFVTVCSEIKQEKLSKLDDLRRTIESLGNPATSASQTMLDESGCIHFMSLNIVEGDASKNEPAILFLELSVDGEKEQALKSLCEYFWEKLKDVYPDYVHGNIETADHLFEHLADNSVEMIQSIWPRFYSGKWRNGLGFSGTPGLSIQQIKDERIIAKYVEDKIEQMGVFATPQRFLFQAKDELLKEETGEIARATNRWIDKNTEPPIFAEVAESPWKSAWSKTTLAIKATPVVVKVWIITLYFLIAGIIWNQLGQFPSLKDHKSYKEAWNFPSNLLPPNKTEAIYISANSLLMSILLAFAFAIFVSWISEKLLRLRAGKIGAIFAFIFILVFLLALAPNSMNCSPTNIGSCNSPYIPVLFGRYLVNATIWVYALMATIILAATTFFIDRRAFWKSASALVAFSLMALLVLTVGDLQLSLLATSNYAAAPNSPSIEGVKLFNWTGFSEHPVINKWNTATPLQMFFYPVVMSTIIASAIFAFNTSYPKFSLFTSRRIYKWLFAALFAFFFFTTFYSSELPSLKRFGTFSLAYFLSIPATIIAVAALAWIVWQVLKLSEANNTPVDEGPDVDNLAAMLGREDKNGVHNHMISVQNLLPEPWRLRFFLPLALHLVLIVLLKNRYRPGFLAAVGTVHYARWIHIAKTNKLVFVSNYDGSWESYLEDFITKSAKGMTGIWSNCVGFPKAKNLFFEGADDGDRFKRWARKSMQPTSFWYSAYPDIGAQEIRRNTLIRDGLARISSPSDAEAWMDLMGSIPRPTFVLQSEKIQSLVFGGSGNLKAGRCLIVRSNVEEGIDPYFRDWVMAIKNDVSFGDTPPQGQAVYVGFSGKGMGLLGCNKGLSQEPGNPNVHQSDCTKFPPAFLMGMDSESRASVLGDLEGENRSSQWSWGNSKKPAHAFLLLYGVPPKQDDCTEKTSFEDIVDHHKNLIRDHKLAYTEIHLNNLPETGLLEEPFGYSDGISQPLVKGTRRAAQRDTSIHAVNPGEFILGYKDNREFYPPSPQVSAHVDEDNLLPSLARSQPQRYPRFQSDAEEKFRDLGRNGTYLVIRQLEQDVDAFETAVADNAKNFKAKPILDEPADFVDETSDMIKAKLMGRWPDGTSLMKRPVKLFPKEVDENKTQKENSITDWVAPKSSRKRTSSHNEFLYGKDDPQGHKCPFGSHIRRTNPRDGLDIENSDGLSIANRHRILRRGRVYNDGEKEGTFFMCLNADIERQFEFIQQTWINSCTFHGLTDEMDPITGQGYGHIDPVTGQREFKSDNFKFTVQDSDKPSTLSGFKPFVTVRGGGYFFVPSKDALEFIAHSADNPLLAKCPDQAKP